MKRLIALTPVLFGNRQYDPGEALPTTSSGYVAAWVEQGTAKWEDDEAEAPEPKNRPKATPLTAEPGAAGIAQPSSGPGTDLVGKVPPPKARGAVKERTRTAPKSKE